MKQGFCISDSVIHHNWALGHFVRHVREEDWREAIKSFCILDSVIHHNWALAAERTCSREIRDLFLTLLFAKQVGPLKYKCLVDPFVCYRDWKCQNYGVQLQGRLSHSPSITGGMSSTSNPTILTGSASLKEFYHFCTQQTFGAW